MTTKPTGGSSGTTNITPDLIPEATVYSLSVASSVVNGVSYPTALTMGISCDALPHYIDIDAGRNKTQLKADLGIPDNREASDAYHVEVTLDGSAPVYTTELAFGQTKPLSLDIPGVLRVRISIATTTKGCGNKENYIALGNPILIQ